MKNIIQPIILALLPFFMISQDVCVIPCGGDIDFGYTTTGDCVWSGPNGYTSTDCINNDMDLCLENDGTYTVVITDDCGNMINESVNVVVSNPNVLIFEIPSQCRLIGAIQNCENPNYYWTAPSGQIITGTLDLNPVDPTECGQWTLTLDDCNGCTSCVDQFDWLFNEPSCCTPPDCFAGLNIIENNCTLTAIVTECDGTPTYAWSTGESTPSIDVAINTTYTVTVTGCCDDPMIASYTATNCNPPPPCDCDVSAVADDANCEIDIFVTGTDCANYTMAVLKYGSDNGTCSQGNCSMEFNLPVVNQTVAASTCDSNNSLSVDYKVVLFPISGSGCFLQEDCVTLDCGTPCSEITLVTNEDPTLTATCITPSQEIRLQSGHIIDFNFPGCCNIPGFTNVGTVDIEDRILINGVLYDSDVSLNTSIINDFFPLDDHNSIVPCGDLEIGDVVTTMIIWTNINITDACGYSGPTSFTLTSTKTITAADIACCVSTCPDIVINLPDYANDNAADKFVFSSGFTASFCGAASAEGVWSITTSGTNPNDGVVFVNNSGCGDQQALTANTAGDNLVTFAQALSDTETYLQTLTGCSSISITQTGNQVTISGASGCLANFTILTSERFITLGGGCFATGTNLSYNDQQLDCCN